MLGSADLFSVKRLPPDNSERNSWQACQTKIPGFSIFLHAITWKRPERRTMGNILYKGSL